MGNVTGNMRIPFKKNGIGHGPSLNTKLFPVHYPSWLNLKGLTGTCFFSLFILHDILAIKKINEGGGGFPALTDWPFF